MILLIIIFVRGFNPYLPCFVTTDAGGSHEAARALPSHSHLCGRFAPPYPVYLVAEVSAIVRVENPHKPTPSFVN